MYLFICVDIVHQRYISAHMHSTWYHDAHTFLPSRMTAPRADGCVYIADAAMYNHLMNKSPNKRI